MAFDDSDVQRMIGAKVVDVSGDKIGTVGQVFLDDTSGEPEWVTVNTGFFGTSESFIPLSGAHLVGDDVQVAYDKPRVKDAPNVDAEAGHLSHEEERELYAYYGLDYSRGDDQVSPNVRGGQAEGTGDTFTPAYEGGSGTQARPDAGPGFDTSGPETDSAMTRSEERLHVDTQSRESGRARLRKYIVTEQQTVTVPVQREEIRLEREPITEANIGDATAGPELSEEEHEVVLHEEQVVVEKKTVPVERVRLDTETVVEDRHVTEDVRKEKIEAEGVDLDRP